MELTYIYDENGDAVGVEIDDVFYKIVGVEYANSTTFAQPNARTPTNSEMALILQKANDLNTYTVKNAGQANPPQNIKTQSKNSFWEGFNADKVFSGIITAVTSIFGNRTQTTDQSSIYAGTTTPYLTQSGTGNSQLYIILIVAAALFFFNSSTNKNQSK